MKPAHPPIDLSNHCHFSSSHLAPLVPQILAGGQVHAGKNTTPEQQADIFYHTLRSASDNMLYNGSQSRFSAAAYEEVGRMVYAQIPRRLRAQVAQLARQGLDFQKNNVGSRGIATTSYETAQEHARHFQKAFTRFGVHFGKPLPPRVKTVREEEPVLAGAR